MARADRAGMRPRTCCPTHADACRFGRDHTWAGPYLLDAGRPVNGAVWSHAGDVLCSTCGGQCVADRVTGESVGRFEFDEEEGIAFWVGNSIKDFPGLFAERADAESVPAPDADVATGEEADRG